MSRYDDPVFRPDADRAFRPTLKTFAAAAILAALYVGLLALMERPIGAFELVSPDFTAERQLPDRLARAGYGCVGENRSPALAWRGAPATTRGYAVTLYDPDAPNREGWWHWIVVDIPADRTGLPATAPGAKPADWPAEARELRTDFGVPGYGGPCPPEGELHRYVLTVYALGIDMPEAPPELTAATIGHWLRSHALARATLTGIYSRP
jgi:Raf kinase inhibitor-like YbhB/YbcL family protein